MAAETAAEPELGRRLRALLDADTNAAARIADAIGGVAASASAPVEWIGQRFGCYQILRTIGRGGMGLVFEAARSDDEYQKTVALKIAPGCHDLHSLGARFRRERQILAGLEHPNIARFLDGGTERGIPYFAMELVRGRPITRYADELRLGVRARIVLLRQVCAAVEYAHQNLVVHCDLKPGNILVDQDGAPKLLDFGIARLLDPGRDAAINTRTLNRTWTPDYASPEQVQSRPVGTRTDVYSLGLILFELLTGERAQVADDSSPAALERSICEAPAQLPSERGPRALRRALSGDLDTIVTMATQKDAGRRYGSVAALSADLEHYLEGRPILARSDSLGYRMRKFARRNWLPLSAAAITGISLAAGAAGLAWEAHIADRRFNEVRKLATTVLLDVHDKIQSLSGATAARETITRAAVESLDALSRDAGYNYPLRREIAGAYLRLGKVQGATVGSSFGRNEQALSSFERGLALLDRMPASELARAAETEAGLREQRGRILVATGRPAEGEPDLARARQVFTALCRDPRKDREACENRFDTLSALIELSIRRRDVGATDGLIKEMGAAGEVLRPVIPSAQYQRERILLAINRGRSEYARGGMPALRRALDPLWEETERMVRDNGTDKLSLRVGVAYSMFYGDDSSRVLRPNARLETIWRRGAEWGEILVRLDPDDRRSRELAAITRGQWAVYVSRRSPPRGATLLRGAVREFTDLARAAPSNVDKLARLVDFSDDFVAMLVRQGRPQDAVTELESVLRLYDPLMMLGLRLERNETVRRVQALAWVAQHGSTRMPGAAWRTHAEQQADAALAADPGNPALQAAAAQLFESLPGTPGGHSQPRAKALELWRSLAARYPANTSVRAKAQ